MKKAVKSGFQEGGCQKDVCQNPKGESLKRKYQKGQNAKASRESIKEGKNAKDCHNNPY